METLTPKQRDVMRLMAKGLTNAQIAERMGISLSGAKWHVSEVLSRLGVDSREEAVAVWKREQGIGRRVSRMAGAFSLPKVVAGGGVAAGIGGVFVAVAMVLGSGGNANELPPASAVEPLATTVAVAERVIPEGTVWTSDERTEAVVPGACEEPAAYGEDAPLCTDMEPNEVRYSIAIEGAAVTIRGLAGAELHNVRLVFADGLDVERNI